MNANEVGKPVEILLVDDSPGDVRLTLMALKAGRITNHISVVGDGDEALAFLRQEGDYVNAPRPDLVLLDLNMPGKTGHEVLAEVKEDASLKRIPVAVLTTSDAEHDILRTYEHHGNCFITKRGDFEQFMKAMHVFEDFWFTIVKLPPR